MHTSLSRTSLPISDRPHCYDLPFFCFQDCRFLVQVPLLLFLFLSYLLVSSSGTKFDPSNHVSSPAFGDLIAFQLVVFVTELVKKGQLCLAGASIAPRCPMRKHLPDKLLLGIGICNMHNIDEALRAADLLRPHVGTLILFFALVCSYLPSKHRLIFR